MGLFQIKRKYERIMRPTAPVINVTGLAQQRRWFKAFYRRFETKEASTMLRKIAFDFLKKVIPRTPVDEGRARAAWTVFFDQDGRVSPNLGDTSQVRKTGGATKVTLNPVAIAEGKEMGRVVKALGKGTAQFIMITNAVPYIVKLEFTGHSKQGQGFVRLTIKEMRAHLLKSADASLRKAIISANTHQGAVRIPSG